MPDEKRGGWMMRPPPPSFISPFRHAKTAVLGIFIFSCVMLLVPNGLWNGNIQSAADGWSDNNDPGDVYGHISNWDTSYVTNMNRGALRLTLCDGQRRID